MKRGFRDWFELALSTLLTIAAVSVAIVVLVREVRSDGNRRPLPTRDRELTATFIADWAQVAKTGLRFGRDSTPTTILVLSDYECPYCRSFHQRLSALQDSVPNELSVAFVHVPLNNHRFARPAARAVECARETGDFVGMHDLIFAKQDSLGLKTWQSFAQDAGVADTAAFNRCAQGREPIPGVAEGLAFAKAVGARGTPTILINGWLLSRAPSNEEIKDWSASLREGRVPVSPIADRRP